MWALALIAVAVLVALAQEHSIGAPQTDGPIAVPGKPVPPDSGKLSEHNLQWLKTQPPQAQMELLLQEVINHDKGATDLIPKNMDSWKGKLARRERVQSLEERTPHTN